MKISCRVFVRFCFLEKKVLVGDGEGRNHIYDSAEDKDDMGREIHARHGANQRNWQAKILGTLKHVIEPPSPEGRIRDLGDSSLGLRTRDLIMMQLRRGPSGEIR